MSLYMATDKASSASRTRTLTSKDVFSSPDSMNKRVPKNSKYANMKATINTGSNAGNVKPKIDRSGECFRRINRRQLHQLMLACEKGDESIYSLQEQWDSVEDADDTSSVQSGRTNHSAMSSSSSASHLPLVSTHAAQQDAKVSNASDYFILLDVRDDENHFTKYHIEGAMHYPPAMLRRDYFPPALYKMKNAPGKLIIVYDSDETSRIALESATLFVQKGFDNVFLLTGGINRFVEKYNSRVTGTNVPTPKSSSSASSSASSRAQALAGAPASVRLNTSSSVSRIGSAAPSARPSARSAVQTPQQQSHSATSLGYTQARERESPRDALGRQQQQQHQHQHHDSTPQNLSPMSQRSTTSQVSALSAYRGMHPAGAGPQQVSARAFR